MPGKPELSKAIRAALKSKKLLQSDIAQLLKVPESTVRTWLKRNTFPGPEGIEMCRLAGLPTKVEELEAKYEIASWITSPSATIAEHLSLLPEKFRLLDLQYLALAKSARAEFGEDVRELFGAMGRDDLFVYCSLDLPPHESTEGGWGETSTMLIKAINNGARLLYLYPDEEAQKRYASLGIETAATADPRRHLDSLKARLREKEVKPQKLRTSLIFTPISDCPFFFPRVKIALYRAYMGDHWQHKSFGRFPTGGEGVAAYLHVPLTQEFSNDFLQFIRRTIETNPTHELKSFFKE